MRVRIIVSCNNCGKTIANYTREWDFKMSFGVMLCSKCNTKENLITVIK